MKNVAIGSDASPARRRPGSARAFSRVLVEYGEMRADPSEVLDDHEVARLLDRIPVTTPLELRDRAMFELACSRGLRAEELVKLDLGALELDPGERTNLLAPSVVDEANGLAGEARARYLALRAELDAMERPR